MGAEGKSCVLQMQLVLSQPLYVFVSDRGGPEALPAKVQLASATKH